MELIKEKWRRDTFLSEAVIRESRICSFDKDHSFLTSYRVHRGDEAGIFASNSTLSDAEGFAKAEENLNRRSRPYPFAPESGRRSRDMTERQLSDKELLSTAEACLDELNRRYPRFRYSGSISQYREIMHTVNDAGMDYSNTDCDVSVNIAFKHVDSKDITDGGFSFSLRDFDPKVFSRMADDFLGSYETPAELPETVIIDMQYYGLLGLLTGSLGAENIALGTSLLSGKLGEKVFSEDFTLTHDVSDKECWFNTFWDGDGCVCENDKFTVIDRGVIVTALADKRDARKYHMPHTKSAAFNFWDIPSAGFFNPRIGRSKKTVKELLAGRPAVIPVQMSGGGFNEKGDYVMPVHCALLYDGDRVVGKLPPFTMRSSMFDMFGKDFIGVGSDQPIYNDKQILFRVQAETNL